MTRAGLPWLGAHEFTVRPYDVDAYPWFREGSCEGKALKHAAIVDVETLGLAPADPVIEVAVRQVAYDPLTGGLYGMTDEYTSLRDPGVPIPEAITALTGITDADVKGRTIDLARLKSILTCDLIVAHNAAFDCPRVSRLMATGIGIPYVPWACSSVQIDWRGHGLPSASLGALCLAHGFYCEAHRALGDVAALVYLLCHHNAETKRSYFAELLTNARKPVVEIFAWGSRFETKDALKARGYRWLDREKVWTRIVEATEEAAETAWLVDNVTSRSEVKLVDPRTRFAA